MQTTAKLIGAHFASHQAASQFIKAGLLLCLAFFSPVFADELDVELTEIKQAQIELDNGNYQKAIALAVTGAEKARKIENSLLISKALDIKAGAEIFLEKYEEAAKTLDTALKVLPENKIKANQEALIYIRYAWLLRSQEKYSESFKRSGTAVEIAPENRYVLAAHYLNTGRILYSSGYDVSSIVWLEKSEKLLESDEISSVKLETYRFLSLAWLSKLNFQKALEYAQKCLSQSDKTQFKYKHRQALFDLQTIYGTSGQEKSALLVLEKGLRLSVEENDSYQAAKFLSSLLLHALDAGDVKRASDYLSRLEKLDAVSHRFSFEVKLGRAVIAALQNQPDIAEKIFAEIEKDEKPSEYALPYWKLIIAEKNQDWEQLIKINQALLDLTVKDNYRDGLPKIYLTFARAYFYLRQTQTSIENLEKCLSYIEELRKSENYNLSLGLSENYHDAYRLLAQIKFGNPQKSFDLADFLKARLLKDRIDNAAAKSQFVISPAVRKTLEQLSLKFIDDHSFAAEIERNENLVANPVAELNLNRPSLEGLDEIAELNEAAIVSYFFTLDGELLAYVWEKGNPLRTVQLRTSEGEIDDLAKTTERKIKNFIFYKRDGQEIYDKLLKPLNLAAKHFVIVPDKSLWKIPFQALSADGEKYLIEEKLVSYAPSVSILLEQIKNPKHNRQNLQAFANPSYNNKFLQYVSGEAAQVAAIYNSKPIQNAAVSDFLPKAAATDILHFSMHAEVDNEQPLESFLSFRKSSADDGRLTVEELLKIKLKRGSLIFLASCDTSNVLSGEGLVSLAWAMMGSGATTVVSAQWEANDKSTQIFTRTFYAEYKRGNSSAAAIRAAALELIKDKSSNMHEPYFWANFTLYGDYR